MQVYKLAMKVAARHWNWLLIYLVALGSIALFGTMGAQQQSQIEFESDVPKVAVIDRDGSELSQGIVDFVNAESEPVQVEDTVYGLQDAAAKNLANYVLIIPDGFEDQLLAAARDGAEMPVLENVISYDSARGAIVDQKVRAYVQSLYGFAAIAQASGSGTYGSVSAADAAATVVAGSADTANAIDLAAITSAATEANGNGVETSLIPVDSSTMSSSYLSYAGFSQYALFTAVAIFVSIGMIGLKKADARRRISAGPVKVSRYSAQVALACLSMGLIAWAIMAGVGLLVHDPLGSGASPASVGIVLLAQLSYALFGSAMGFLMWQMGMSEAGANGFGNIVGLVLSFFSGVWLPTSMMSPAVLEVARFTPFFGASDAMTTVFEAPVLTQDVLAQAFGGIGTTLLFAVAVAAIAVAVGRAKMREAE